MHAELVVHPVVPSGGDVSRAVEWAARSAYGRLVATLALRTRDVAAAEDALSDAFQAALTQWTETGVPEHPDAWLLAVARRRLTDGGRRRAVAERAVPALEYAAMQLQETAASDSSLLPDRRAELLFACAHPAIDDTLHAPLMLQVILGLEAERIAAAFLVKPSAMAQRLVRAKRKLRDAGVRFAMPEAHELPGRLAPVLEAIYAAFGAGWEDVHGGESLQDGLSDEAIWLARVVVGAFPAHAEALGLLSMMLYCHARRTARSGHGGRYIPLDEQELARWDAGAIAEAERTLVRAAQLRAPGRFQTEAAIQSWHTARRRGLAADVRVLRQLYDALATFAPTVGVAVNRAAAYGTVGDQVDMAAALAMLDAVPADLIATYQPWWALRGYLLASVGAHADAIAAYDRAIGLSSRASVRAYLLEQRGRLRADGA